MNVLEEMFVILAQRCRIHSRWTCNVFGSCWKWPWEFPSVMHWWSIKTRLESRTRMMRANTHTSKNGCLSRLCQVWLCPFFGFGQSFSPLLTLEPQIHILKPGGIYSFCQPRLKHFISGIKMLLWRVFGVVLWKEIKHRGRFFSGDGCTNS